MGNLEAAAKKAEAAIVPALDLIDAAKGEDARLAAQLGLEDRAVELAEALEAKHFSDDATLPPKGSFSDVDTLLSALEPPPEAGAGALAPVRLLKVSWLLERANQLILAPPGAAREALRLPTRQQLERNHPDAFTSAQEIRAQPSFNNDLRFGRLPICAVSYCWLTPEHPDPEGEQLISLAKTIERAAHRIDANGKCFPVKEAVIFMDYVSLCQKDEETGLRTDAESAAFGLALKTMQIWYAHELTTVFFIRTLPDNPRWAHLNPYDQRGWTTCEFSWALLAKTSGNAQRRSAIYDVVRLAGNTTAGPGGAGSHFRRLPPASPTSMARLIAQKKFTSKKGDLAMVIGLNVRTIISVLRDAVMLDYSDLAWGAREACQLASVLPYCKCLEQLLLTRNELGDDGASAIASVLPQLPPTLNCLGLQANHISTAGAVALAAGLKGIAPRPDGSTLTVYVSFNHDMGRSGIGALQQARDECTPWLKVAFT